MKRVFIAIMSVAIFITSCDKGNTSKKTSEKRIEKEVEKEDPIDEKKSRKSSAAICLLDRLSVRETPEPKGKWLTSMSLGEKVMLLGEETTEPKTKKLYYKVKLSDGKKGWTPARFLAVSEKVGVMLEEASVYKRPELLTKTDKKYSVMDIIAVVENQNDWLKVKGKRAKGKYIEEGWIKSSNFSESAVDIAMAKFANMALGKETMTERIKALEEVLENNDLSSSAFVDILRAKARDYESKNTSLIEDDKELLNDD
ncbi:SH3 domain-containing protein [Tenacibaculum maritimum]|uniref:SH3 domain-containing protein n=1 Tax=Tenacibaculum maritimum TaxID=107401 RepID=UPI000404BFFF|nr:SH3 domain-containing protein [Tenacibaculum maritimum]